MNAFCFKTLAALVLVALSAGAARAVTIDMVTVGNPGNANDTTGYGAVADSYQIGKYGVTIQQYTDFLNAAAKSDPYSLYNSSMATDLNIAGIQRSGDSGSHTYSVINNGGFSGNRPVTYVSWFDAARLPTGCRTAKGRGARRQERTRSWAARRAVWPRRRMPVPRSTSLRRTSGTRRRITRQ